MIDGNFVSIIGGAGHVGVPLGLALSSKGFNVILVDKNKKNINKIYNANFFPSIPLLKNHALITKKNGFKNSEG